MHTPVLLKEAIAALRVKSDGRYIDATAGEGGHLKSILKLGGRVLAIDRDEQQIESLKKELREEQKLILVVGNFADIEKIACEKDFAPVDGVIFDLGLSLRQIRESGKGFTYKNPDEPLDMRLSASIKKTAADLVNSLSKENLYEILAGYSEEVNSWAIAGGIVSARVLRKINSVGDLTAVIDKALKRSDRKVYSRVFQALRIAVNSEFENLKAGLKGAVKILKEDGRIVVISFHSLEDRIVKKFVKENKLSFLGKKPIFGDSSLSFERSAKLRIILKKT